MGEGLQRASARASRLTDDARKFLRDLDMAEGDKSFRWDGP